jgi:hypothetical protein
MATASVLTWRVRGLVGLAGVLIPTLMTGGLGVWAEDDDVPLRRSAGPYRGVVLDEQTGRPLPSAAVIILWQRLDDQTQGLRRLVSAREAFTNEHGEFVHDVAAVESRVPPGTFAPRLLIFRPGYAPLPSQPQLFPPGVAASRFADAGAAAKLTPITDHEDRAEALNVFIAMLNASHLLPSPDLPETFDMIRSELESLGARLPKPVTPRSSP